MDVQIPLDLFLFVLDPAFASSLTHCLQKSN